MTVGKINYGKHINEGWTVQGYVDELTPAFEVIQSGGSWKEPLKTRKEVKEWCIDNQPYYKKYIPDVVNHFCIMYGIK